MIYLQCGQVERMSFRIHPLHVLGQRVPPFAQLVPHDAIDAGTKAPQRNRQVVSVRNVLQPVVNPVSALPHYSTQKSIGTGRFLQVCLNILGERQRCLGNRMVHLAGQPGQFTAGLQHKADQAKQPFQQKQAAVRAGGRDISGGRLGSRVRCHDPILVRFSVHRCTL